jgi:hypothetical protein
MDIDMETLFKLLAFVLWPFLLLLLVYLFDKKGFKKRFDKFKQNGFK